MRQSRCPGRDNPRRRTCGPRASGTRPKTTHPQKTVDYSIIVTGNELLSGVYADGHTIHLTKTLRPLGLHCVGSVSVDDQAEDIRQALQFTLSRSKLVIVTGGLGPTESDITRDVLSAFTGIELREQPEVLREMEQRFRTSRDQLRANLRRQTRVPIQGTFLPNNSGTAVGLVFEQEDSVIVALPGPPRELQPMVRDHLIPYLARKFGVHKLGCTLTVRFVGLGQSQIDQTMKDHIRLPADVMQTSQFESGRVDFTFSLPGDSAADRQRLEQLRDDLHKYMGDHIYADDARTTLEEAAIKQLDAQGQTVVVVEWGSGGIGGCRVCSKSTRSSCARRRLCRVRSQTTLPHFADPFRPMAGGRHCHAAGILGQNRSRACAERLGDRGGATRARRGDWRKTGTHLDQDAQRKTPPPLVALARLVTREPHSARHAAVPIPAPSGQVAARQRGDAQHGS